MDALLITYADLHKRFDALIDLNYNIEEEEDFMDLEDGEEVIEEEAGWYIEDINQDLLELHRICQTMHLPDANDNIKQIVDYVTNWEHGKYDVEYEEYSKYSPVAIIKCPAQV